ncbi:MAG TPA: PDZ domain-containing protein [Saprospiraceae bacterium]|nr:PDZ domain-containing protein [Saprospiraceae bacterium]HMP23926.1 PDZ domain-containing protein [Saprospiraceae bacterium]
MKHLLNALSLLLLIATSANAIAQSGGRAYLGIHSEPVSKAKARILGFDNAHGAYVTKVISNSAAEAVGMQVFDYIYKIDKEEVSANRDLSDLLATYRAGQRATVHFIRKGKKQSAEVTFSGRVSDAAEARSKKGFLGVSPHNNTSEREIGVKVYIVRNSTAEAMGMQDGDLIRTINGHPMVDWDDISTALGVVSAGEPIAVEFVRKGKTMRAEGVLNATPDPKEAAISAAGGARIINEWGHLGIYSNTVSKEKARQLGFDNPYGSYVIRVISGSGAEQAGLQPFDYVYGINDYRTNAAENLTNILKRFSPGEQATVHFIRQGENRQATLTFSKRSEVSSVMEPGPCDSPMLGVQQMGTPSTTGVAVGIVPKSTAAEIGLETGDRITKINGYPIIDWSDISTAVDNTQVGATVEITWLRKGETFTDKGQMKSHCDTYSEDGGSLFSSHDSNGESAPIRDIDIRNAVVELKTIPGEEIRALNQQLGLNLSDSNTLNISDLRITPNAAAERFQLEFNLPDNGETSVNVYNATGRLIYNYDLGTFGGAFSDLIDLSQNGAGNYFLEIRQGSQSIAKKILLETR